MMYILGVLLLPAGKLSSCRDGKGRLHGNKPIPSSTLPTRILCAVVCARAMASICLFYSRHVARFLTARQVSLLPHIHISSILLQCRAAEGKPERKASATLMIISGLKWCHLKICSYLYLIFLLYVYFIPKKRK